MKNKKLFYIPLAFACLILFSVLAVHFTYLGRIINRDSTTYQVSFAYFDGVVNLGEGGRKAGLEIGDKVLTFNGAPVEGRKDFYEKLRKINSPDPIILEIERQLADKRTVKKQIQITPVMTTLKISHSPVQPATIQNITKPKQLIQTVR